jgi:hypothetical protein
MADSWKRFTGKVVVPGEKMFKLSVETPDDGGKLGLAIEDNLMKLYEHSQENNIFANPKLVLNDPSVDKNAGGQHGIGTGEISQGRPCIQLPPDHSGEVYCTPPDPMEPQKKTLRVRLSIEQAAILLHEVNHSIHRFVNNGEYMQPNSSRVLGAVDQNLNMGIMSKSLQSTHNFGQAFMYKKANEMETYWLCCCDAAKYHFSEEAVKAIKALNNKNLLGAGYEKLSSDKQFATLVKHNDDNNLWSKVYDIEQLDPSTYNPPRDDLFNGLDDEQQPEIQNSI